MYLYDTKDLLKDLPEFKSTTAISKDMVVELEMANKLADLIITHKNNFIRNFVGKYIEILPNTRSYKGVEGDYTSIDFNALEIDLRLERIKYPVICRTTKGNFLYCGYIRNGNEKLTRNNHRNRLTQDDIIFTVNRNLFDKKLREIFYDDNCNSGDFVVLRNKLIDGVSDFKIIKHYAIELGEMVSSKLSIIIQSKVNSLILGDENDESLNNLIQSIYAGIPFVKTGNLFDIEDNHYLLDNTDLINVLTEIKRQYQNSVNELNLQIAINSLGVDKESGVSDIEAQSNITSVQPIASNYLTPIQEALNKLNLRFGGKLQVTYNNVIVTNLLVGDSKNG